MTTVLVSTSAYEPVLRELTSYTNLDDECDKQATVFGGLLTTSTLTTTEVPWRNFKVHSFGTKFPREVPLVLEISMHDKSKSPFRQN